MSTDTGIGGVGGAWWATLAQSDEVLGAPGSAGAAAPPAGPAGEAGAVEGADGAAPGGAPGARSGGGMDLLFPLLIGLMLFMIISTMLSGRKEKKRRAAMLAAVSKHAKVQTIGGVIGTVAEVRDSEIVLTVDRATQTRMTFAKSAVQQVLVEGRGESSDSDVDEPELERVGA